MYGILCCVLTFSYMAPTDAPSFEPKPKVRETLQPTETRESIQNETRARLSQLRNEVQASLPKTQPGGQIVDGPVGVVGSVVPEGGNVVTPVLDVSQAGGEVGSHPFNIDGQATAQPAGAIVDGPVGVVGSVVLEGGSEVVPVLDTKQDQATAQNSLNI